MTGEVVSEVSFALSPRLLPGAGVVVWDFSCPAGERARSGELHLPACLAASARGPGSCRFAALVLAARAAVAAGASSSSSSPPWSLAHFLPPSASCYPAGSEAGCWAGICKQDPPGSSGVLGLRGIWPVARRQDRGGAESPPRNYG